jgi:uncharacterized Zn finger protein
MNFWPRYVPVAERRAKARREMNKLRKRGKDIQPVEIDGRTIARSFWGKGWCDHLESFSDYANRLPRGRTYVRNGSVCHLAIRPGRVEAVVSGSELYDVVIRIQALPAATWKSIKSKCAGQIGSMLELLQGKLSDQVMAIVSHRQHGLFPKPGEIQLDCSCPDWAVMCKHVAAVLYGVGSRLDSRPELLFLLRDVDAQELITAEMALPETVAADDTLADEQLGAIFDIDLDTEPDARPARPAKPQKRSRAATPVASITKRQTARSRQDRKIATSATSAGRSAKVATQAAPKVTRRTKSPQTTATTLHAVARASTAAPPKIRPTGKSVARLRKQQGLSVAQFAARLGVSSASIYRWEATPGRLNLQAGPLNALALLHQQAKKEPTGSHAGRP